MKYTLEDIYLSVGREDNVAGLSLRKGSDAHKLHGDYITVVFIYTQYEREEMDERVKTKPFSTTGFLRARYLSFDLPPEVNHRLQTDGIHSDDIEHLFYLNLPAQNTFHQQEKRTITKLNIAVERLPEGKDIDFSYHFAKGQVRDGIGLSPEDRRFYLAAKLFFEPNQMTLDEMQEIISATEKSSEKVEWEILRIRYKKGVATTEEKRKLGRMIRVRENNAMNLADKYLKQAGSSLTKLTRENPDLAAKLVIKVLFYKERRLNTVGKLAIYVDVDRYLHIFMRHVAEMKVGAHFDGKDNFQWAEEDVFIVMEKVINKVNDQIQAHFQNKPDKRYSRWGRHSVYFEGDYYTFHIEPSGLVSTFHKNWKKPPAV